jgi:Pilus formation protein N terminal region
MDLTGIVKAAAGAMAVAAMWAVAIPEASAQDPNNGQSRPVQAVTGTRQQITLTMGEGELFETSAPYAKVSVTDEKIAQVTPQSDREFVLNPRGVGSTNVFVLDNKNTLIARLDVNVVGRAAGIQPAGEPPGNVRVYGRIYDSHGAVVKPATYQCSDRDCEIVSEAPLAAPAPMEGPNAGPYPAAASAPSPAAGAPTGNENTQ